MSEPTLVYVAGGRNGGEKGVKLHVDERCERLKNARNTIGRERDHYPADTDYCQCCTGSVTQPDSQDLSYQRALTRASQLEQ